MALTPFSGADQADFLGKSTILAVLAGRQGVSANRRQIAGVQ
jgi:hypothetical protein